MALRIPRLRDRSNGNKLTDETLKEAARSADKDEDPQTAARDVKGIRMLLAGNAPQPVDVQVVDPNTDEIPF